MSISFVALNSTLNSVSGTSTAIVVPSGAAVTNMLYALVANVGNSPTVDTPSGWALVSSFSPGTTLTSYLFSRPVVTGVPGSTVTWTWSSSGRNLGVIAAYAGVDPAASTNAGQVWTHDVDNAPIAAPVMAANAGDWLVTVGVGRENPGTATTKNWTVTGDTQRADVATGGASTDVKVSLGWFDSAADLAAGSTSRTANVTPVLQQSHVWSILLNPTPPAVGGNPWSYVGRPW